VNSVGKREFVQAGVFIRRGFQYKPSIGQDFLTQQLQFRK
jgi:hypothetical protein